MSGDTSLDFTLEEVSGSGSEYIGSLSGFVQDEKGNPLGDVRIHITTGDFQFETVSSGSGHFLLEYMLFHFLLLHIF